ncbi:MAG TPA: nitronate monooxygenase [Syntrophomonadaceae bacterium]|nr:nitronate monooxygenase [Syntrophomonadaceae bacterium]
MNTRITDMLGIEKPIICGGMLWLATPELAAAISNAGGLGNITAANYNSGEELRAAIRKAKGLTEKPFGINITLLPSLRLTDSVLDDFFAVCCEEKVKAIEVSAKYAAKYIDLLHEAGIKVFHKVGSVRHAVIAEKLGYDGVFAAGWEEGGHPLDDDVTSVVLWPRIAETVKIPVVAAGGIADGRGLAAALSLGAEGVMMATRFISTVECHAHPNIKKELIKRQEMDTTLIDKKLNLQGRALKNALVEEILDLEEKGAQLKDIFPLITGQRVKQAWVDGDVAKAAFMVGQSIGLIKNVVSCQQLLDDMVFEAETIIKRVSRLF